MPHYTPHPKSCHEKDNDRKKNKKQNKQKISRQKLNIYIQKHLATTSEGKAIR